jgi:hypothetical protein
MQISYKDNKKVTLNNISSNLVPESDSGKGNFSLGFSKTAKNFET